MVKSMMMAVLTTQSKVFWGADLCGDNFIETFTLAHPFSHLYGCYKPISFCMKVLGAAKDLAVFSLQFLIDNS